VVVRKLWNKIVIEVDHEGNMFGLFATDETIMPRNFVVVSSTQLSVFWRVVTRGSSEPAWRGDT